MTMIIEVQHETCLRYSAPVSESVSEVRMEPGSDGHQSCRSFHLMVSPPTERFRYQDGFGNRVHHFNLRSTHDEVRILAAAVVETHPEPCDLQASTALYPLDPATFSLEVHDYIKLRGPCRHTPRLQPLLDELRPPPGTRLADLVSAVSSYIKTHFQYGKDVTLATSPIDDVLLMRRGVCQDFTHLMLAILRSFGVPARYVSGYVHRANKESQSHAWCEVWFPDLGWVGIDPTNDCRVHEHFIKVGVGRDFTDVPPNRGVYRGAGQESICVRVETRQLTQAPSVAWQEQLAPLSVPLAAIVTREQLQEAAKLEEEMQQQQQQ
jgi:transglutaminase-like putative cysteine protease